MVVGGIAVATGGSVVGTSISEEKGFNIIHVNVRLLIVNNNE